ncbi:ApaLI family restriction endonuclease, partial [Vibrio parahaemolyticus]
EYCKSIGLDTKGKNVPELRDAIYKLEREEIDSAISKGLGLELLKEKIGKLADDYAHNLSMKIDDRKEDMKSDDNSHYLIYRVLGISNEE